MPCPFLCLVGDSENQCRPTASQWYFVRVENLLCYLRTVSKAQKGEQMSCSKEFMHKKAALHLNEWFTLNFFNMPIEKGIKEHYHNADRAFFLFLHCITSNIRFECVCLKTCDFIFWSSLKTFKFILCIPFSFSECVNTICTVHAWCF